MFQNSELRVVRCMPNTPATDWTGCLGAICQRSRQPRAKAASRLRHAGRGHRFLARTTSRKSTRLRLCPAVGRLISFAFIEAMIKAGEKLGLEHGIATQLTLQTALGAASLANNSNEPVDILRKNVTSPGGTTARARWTALIVRGSQKWYPKPWKRALIGR